MARKKSPVSIRVKDSVTEGEQRLVSIEIVAPQSCFVLSDTFAQEGAIEALPKRLKDTIREVVEAYIDSGSQTLAEVSKLLKERPLSQETTPEAPKAEPQLALNAAPERSAPKATASIATSVVRESIGVGEPVFKSIDTETDELVVSPAPVASPKREAGFFSRVAKRSDDAVSALYDKR